MNACNRPILATDVTSGYACWFYGYYFTCPEVGGSTTG